MTRSAAPLRALFAFALLLSTSACGGDDASDVSTAGTATPEAEAPATGDQLFDRQFGQVCRGTGQPAGAAYTPGPGVHPVLAMQSDDGADYTGTILRLPDGWAAQWPQLDQTELVLCTHRTATTPGQMCEGYKDDDSGSEWTVQTFGASYEYVLRVARTAEEVARTTFDVPAGRCPMLSTYSTGDPQPVPSYATPSDGQVELFLQPTVTGG